MELKNKKSDLMLKPLNSNEVVGINGGSWISFAIGYVLGLMDASPSVDHTKYGGAYLETVNGRSTIM